MKATGIVRPIDNLGRIVLPIELRRIMNLNEKDLLEIFVEEDRIVLEKYQRTCIFCGSSPYNARIPDVERRKVS